MTRASSISSSEVPAAARAGAFSRWLLVWAVAALGFFAVFFGASEWLIRTRVEAVDDLGRHIAFLRSATSPNAVFGDSIAAFGFAGQPDFVNLAFPTESIAVVDGKLRTYFADKRPGQVIIQADPIQLTAYRNDKDYRERISAYTYAFPLRVFSAANRGRLVGYWRAWLSGGFSPSRYRVSADGELNLKDQHYKGPHLTPPEWARYAIAGTPLPPRLAAVTDRSYRDIVDFVQRRGGTVCLLSFPVLKEFRDARAKIPAFHEAYAYFDELAAETGARRVDLSAFFDDESWYIDEDHLNLKAAPILAAEAVKRCFGT